MVIKNNDITKIAFDIDGCVRETYKILEDKYKFKVKEYNFVHNGMNFWDMLEENKNMFKDASPTKYYKTILKYAPPPIEFWTMQLKDYRQDTYYWLKKYFGEGNFIVKYFNSSEEKYEHLKNNKEYLLVEDTDQFKEYNRVVLIDAPYNKHIKEAYRITRCNQLRDIILGVYCD